MWEREFVARLSGRSEPPGHLRLLAWQDLGSGEPRRRSQLCVAVCRNGTAEGRGVGGRRKPGHRLRGRERKRGVAKGEGRGWA